jgi:hypothetical protein
LGGRESSDYAQIRRIFSQACGVTRAGIEEGWRSPGWGFVTSAGSAWFAMSNRNEDEEDDD